MKTTFARKFVPANVMYWTVKFQFNKEEMPNLLPNECNASDLMRR
jgi:hypothetical protein